MAAKLKKIIQLTKKNEEKMKKLMFISNVIFSAILAGLAISYTIGSIIMAGWQSWHIGFVAIAIISVLMLVLAVKDAIKVFNS